MQRVKIATLLIFTCFAVVISTSESPYIGKVKLSSGKTAVLHPFSDQPHIANIKNNIVELVIINQKQACSILKKIQRQTDQPPVFAIIDLSKQSSCRMKNQIANVKQAGGKGFIVVTDNQTFSNGFCRMFDQNSFFTGFMNSENFKLILNEKSDQTFGSLTIQPKDANAAQIQIWASSLNNASYQTQIAFGKALQNLQSLQSKIKWRIRIATLGSVHGDNPNICNSDDFVSSCGCKGQFCSPQKHGKVPTILIKQDIRQNLIFNIHITKYFSYIEQFKQQCLGIYQNSFYVEDCATNVMNGLGINSYSINNEVQSFLQKCEGEDDMIKKTQLYSILDKDRNGFVKYGKYPLILLNKQIIDFKSQNQLQNQLCRKLNLNDSNCFQVSESKTVNTTITGVIFYIMLVICLIAIGATVVIFYRKKLKRDMNKQIKMQVSTAVQHYFALTETSSKK